MGQIKWKDTLISYSFLLPFLILASVFSFLPMIIIVLLSFTEGTLLNIDQIRWVGFENFTRVFSNFQQYMGGFANTLFYFAFIIPCGQIIALTLAFLICQKNKYNAIFETVFFIPLIITMVAAGVIFAYVFALEGPLNYVLSLLGIPAFNWLNYPFSAKISVGILEIWKGATFYTFIYLAALRNIPSEYVDAARIDGCNRLQEIFKVILPLMKNAILLCVVMSTIFMAQIFDSIYILTNGGPLRGSESVVFSIYRVTLLDDRIGVGAAMSLIFLVIILTISIIQMRVIKSDTEY